MSNLAALQPTVFMRTLTYKIRQLRDPRASPDGALALACSSGRTFRGVRGVEFLAQAMNRLRIVNEVVNHKGQIAEH